MELKNFDFYFKIIKIIAAIITIIAGSIGIYKNFSEDRIKLEVMAVEKIELTKFPDIDGLSAKYTYKDSVAENIWKVSSLIKNVSSKIIIVQGNNRNTITETLPISFKDSVKILSAKIDTSNFPISIIDTNDNSISLDFKQWKPSEYVYIVAIVQNFGDTEPSIVVDDRDIIDSKVIMSDYKSIQENKNKKLIEYFALPSILIIFLKAGIVGSILGLVIGLTMVAIEKSPKLKKVDRILGAMFMILTLASLLWMF